MTFLIKFFQKDITNVSFFCVLISLLILFGTHSTLFSVCALVISLLYVLSAKNNQEFILMAFLISFASLFKYSADGSSFYTIILLCCVIKYVLSDFKLIKEMYLFIFFVIFEQLVFGNFTFSTTIKLCGGLIYIYYGLNRLNQQQSVACFWAFALGIFFSSMFFFLDSDFFNIKQFVNGTCALEGTFGKNIIYRFTGLYNDPNYYAVNLIVALVLFTILYYNEKINFFVLLVIFVVFGYFTVITYSKSCFLAFFYPIALVLYICCLKKKFGILSILISTIAIFSSYVAMGKFSFLNIIINRFARSSTTNELTTGRTNIWIDYYDFFENNICNLFYGSSISAPLVKGFQAHNTYIEILYTCGVIGFILYFWVMRRLFVSNDLFKKRKIFLNYSVLFCLMIMYFFLSEFLAYDLTWHLLLAGLVYKMNFVDV